MSFKGFLQKFAFLSHNDSGDDQDFKKSEKSLKIFNKEQAINAFMFDSAYFDNETETALMRMNKSNEVCQDAVKWFQSELKLKRDMVWKKLMAERKVDLPSAMPFLINANKTDIVWPNLENAAKNYIDEWQRRANFTILEMFLLRHEVLPLSKKIKNALFVKKK